MNNKLRNAFLGAVLTSGLTACTASQGILPVATDTDNDIDTSYHPIIEIRDVITLGETYRIESEFNNAVRAIYNNNNPNQHSITITIDSPGGVVNEGYRIMDQIKNSPMPVHLKCENQAASIAAIILIAATGINRDATEDCSIMIHQSYFNIFDPHIPNRIIGKTIYEDMQPHYEIVKQNPASQKVTIKQKGYPPYDLSRTTLIYWFEKLAEYRNTVKDKLSATTSLNPNDIEIMLGKGDVYFSAESAAFAGMIDTINGAPPTEMQLQQGQIEFCSNLPQLSLCT